MACQPKLARAKAGGANESRTRDLLHAMQARYQLRYSPSLRNFIFTTASTLKKLLGGMPNKNKAEFARK